MSKLVGRNQKKSDYEVDPFTESEIKKVLSYANKYDPLIKNFLQFAFYTDLRTSELFGLQWGDVNWDCQTVRIQRAVVERKTKETKTEAGQRDLFLVPMAYTALLAQKPYSFVENDYIFIRPRNRGAFIDYEHLERPWMHILKAAHVRYRNPYQTRHSCLSGGENILYIANQMGHKNTEMVMRHYARWVEQGKETQQHENVSLYGQENGASVEYGNTPKLQLID